MRRLPITAAAMPSASTSGTPLRVRIARVEAKRAVLVARTSRPTSGSRRMKLCQRSLMLGSRNAWRMPMASATMPSMISQPQRCTTSLTAIRPVVSAGNSWPVLTKTLTTSGTT